MTWEFFISNEHLIELAISLGIILLFLLFRRIFAKYILKILLRFGRKINSKFLPNLLNAFERPLHWLFIVIGIYVALIYYPYFDHAQILLVKWLKSIFVILFTWGLVNLVSVSSDLFHFINEKTNVKLDDILIPFLSRILQFVIITISLSIILQEFNYQIGGLITGLGLGGLAVSLAAQDAIANLFGGVVIVTEKPFTIDDWISTPSVEGTVEDISFRSTKIRTFEQALVTVPNATLSNEPITNWSKMGKRQVSFSIPITFHTERSKLTAVVKEIEELLRSNSGVHNETILVNINEFVENGMHLKIYFFTKSTVSKEYLAVREQIHLDIIDILAKHEVEIARPSRTLFVKNEQEENAEKEKK